MANFETGKVNMRKSLVALFCANDKFEAFVNECMEKHKNGDYGIVHESVIQLNKECIEGHRGIVISCFPFEDEGEIIPISFGTRMDTGVTYVDIRPSCAE